MRSVLEFAEAFALCMIIGVVVLLGAATLIHAVSDNPEYRADLTRPPAALLCPDVSGHCKAGQ